MNISIDLVPYKATLSVQDKGLTIWDCAGSILAKLNTDEAVTDWPGSDAHIYAEQDGEYMQVYYDADEGICDFIITSSDKISPDLVARWIDRKYDAIADIGWEVLQTEDEK